MAPNAQNGPLSLPAASAAFASTLYLAAVLGVNGVDLPTVGGPILGLNTTKAASGKAVQIEHRPGVRQFFVGGGVTARGDKLKVTAAGKFVTASAQDVLDGKAVALCIDGTAADGRVGSLVLIGGNAVTTLGASESPSGVAGNYDTSALTDETLLTLGTANRTGALANGSVVGQKKKIRVIAASGGFTYALTPATMKAGEPTAFTFTAKDQYVELTWTATGWFVTDIKTAGTGTTAAAGTINPLIAYQNLTVGSAGAEDRILPNGYIAGHQITIVVGTIGSGTTTISGLFYDEDGSADGTDLTYNAAADQATLVWDGARWLATTLVSVTIT